MESPLTSTSASTIPPESERVCWLCLCGSEAGPLTLPCKCPSMYSHPACLGRWQLQSAGKEEERFCRFCRTALPGWTQSLLDDPAPQPQKPAVPVMAVVFNGRVVKLPCTPGKEGAELFKKQIREIFQLDDSVNLDVTFELKVPIAKEQTESRTTPTDQKVYLKGFHTFDAASKVAAICAAKRMARKSSRADALLRSASTGIPEASTSGDSSSSGSSATASAVHRHVQRISAPATSATSPSLPSPSLPSAPPPSPCARSPSAAAATSTFEAATNPRPVPSQSATSTWQQRQPVMRSASAALPSLSVLNYAGSTCLSDPEPNTASSYSIDSRQFSPRPSASREFAAAQAPGAGQQGSAAVSALPKSLSKRIVHKIKSLFTFDS